uniref:Uncharacterized protein n=1 Tax=Trichogramma kaykai TaxID=54128 RepID=A0ABD2X5W1_9HYME
MNYLHEIINKWIIAGAPAIRQIVTDGSKALQNAVSLCYNKCSFKKYLDWCHRLAMGSKIELPNCYIRADIAHLIKAACRWNCFPKDNEIAKDFYVRLIACLSKVDNFKDFSKIIFQIFIACGSSKLSETTSHSIDCLKDIIKSHKLHLCDDECECDLCCEPTLDEYHLKKTNKNTPQDAEAKQKESVNEDEKNESVNEDEKHESVNEEKTNESVNEGNKNSSLIVNAIKDIQASASEHFCHDCQLSDNKYFCKDLIKNITVLFTEYPTWTNIMLETFGSKIMVATSGRSECLFSDLRNITEISRPITCQLFIAEYVNYYLRGSVNTAMSDLINSTLKSPHLQSRRKKLKKVVNRKRGKYLEKCPDIEERHKQTKKIKKPTLIRNANLGMPIELNSVYHAFEASMFDSIFELCHSDFSNFHSYSFQVSESCKLHNSCFMTFVKKYATNANDKSFKFEEERLKLSLQFFDFNDGKMINNISFEQLIERMFKKCFSDVFLISMTKSFADEKILNISKLEYYIQAFLKQTNNKLDFFFFVNMKEFETQDIVLSNIPEKIVFSGEVYILAGAVGFTQSKFNSNFVHYHSYCRTINNTWFIKNDQAKKIMRINEHATIEKFCILMYVQSIID